MACLLFLLISVSASAHEEQFQAVRSYLTDHSQLKNSLTNDRAEQLIVTHLEKYSGDKYILIYERWQYDAAHMDEPTSSQMITYTFSYQDLDQTSLNIIGVNNPSDPVAYWIVDISIREETEFISYKNYTDTAIEGSPPSRSTSKGKARKITLGYFSNQEQAQEFSDTFKVWLKAITHPDQ